MMQGERGHLNCALGLADRLRSEGYDVQFVGLADDAEYVLAYGFPYRVMGEVFWPKGAKRAAQKETPKSFLAMLRKELASIRADLKRASQLLHSLSGSPDERRLFQCDLLIADEMSPWGAIFALHLRLPVVLLATGFPTAAHHPPSHSSLVPRETWFSRLQVRLVQCSTWLYRGPVICVAFFVLRHYGLYPGMIFKRLKLDPRLILRQVPLELALPTLIAVPEEFDFNIPAGYQPLACYAAPWIVPEQSDASESVKSHPGELEVCVALGSHQTFQVRSVIRSVLEVARSKPEWTFVIAGVSDSDRELTPPANVTLHQSIEQIKQLRRSDVIITHCGLNSVKEAISLGVPLVGIPLWRDQPSIAMRLEEHKVGVVVKPGTITEEILISAIEKAVSDPVYQHGLARMHGIFSRAVTNDNSLILIRQLLGEA